MDHECLSKVFEGLSLDGFLNYYAWFFSETVFKVKNILSNEYSLYWVVYFLFGFNIISLILSKLLGLKGRLPSGTSEASIVSYEVMGAIVCGYMSFYGFSLWLGKFGEVNPNFGDEPYKENSSLVAHICTPMLLFQAWNFVISCFIKEYRSFDSLAHHVAVIWVVLLILDPLWQNYAIFYLGICEFSSIFFAVCQIFRYVSPLAIAYPSINEKFKIIFPLTFFCIRLFLFFYMNFYFYIDTYKLVCLSSSVKSYANAVSFLVINVIISTLQILWSVKLWKLVIKTIKSPNHSTVHT